MAWLSYSRGWGRLLRVALDRAEPAIEWLIRLCGWSAIIFVFSILLFVFCIAVPVLFGKLNLIEFFTSARWQPSSEVRPEYGTLALLDYIERAAQSFCPCVMRFHCSNVTWLGQP